MPEIEARWPCPVCLGVKMEKTPVGVGPPVPRSESAAADAQALLLDHCERCGGVWFELGEVQRLAAQRPATLWAEITPRDEIHRAQCHSCRSLVGRDDDECPSCGAPTRLPCPVCERTMDQVRHGDLSLDVCKRCKGVWFDHHELAAIWQLERDKLVKKHRSRSKLGAAAEDGSAVLFETLIWAPDLVFYGAAAAGRGLAIAAEGLMDSPELAAGAAEAVGSLAARVFEVIVDIVGGIFS